MSFCSPAFIHRNYLKCNISNFEFKLLKTKKAVSSRELTAFGAGGGT